LGKGKGGKNVIQNKGTINKTASYIMPKREKKKGTAASKGGGGKGCLLVFRMVRKKKRGREKGKRSCLRAEKTEKGGGGKGKGPSLLRIKLEDDQPRPELCPKKGGRPLRLLISKKRKKGKKNVFSQLTTVGDWLAVDGKKRGVTHEDTQEGGGTRGGGKSRCLGTGCAESPGQKKRK